MKCHEKILYALNQTHRALVACSECIDNLPEGDAEALRSFCAKLADEANRLHRVLLQHARCGEDA